MPILVRFLLKPLIASLIRPALAAIGVFLLTLAVGSKLDQPRRKYRARADSSPQDFRPENSDADGAQASQPIYAASEEQLDVREAEELVQKLSSHVAVPQSSVGRG